MAFKLPVDIVNRALQHCGQKRIFTLDDQSAAAQEYGFSYDALRTAELQRDLWVFATRRVVLRPVDTVTAVLATNAQTLSGLTLPFTSTTGVVVGQLVTGTNIAAGSTVASIIADTSVTLSLAISGTVASGAAITFGPLTFTWTPPDYVAATTYLVGQVVVDTAGDWWQSKVAANVGNTPAVGAYWTHYSGNDSMQSWDTDTCYYPGELTLASSGAVYMSLIAGGQQGNDPTLTTGFWRIVNGSATGLSILYPIGNWAQQAYRLPHGYLRQAPTWPRGLDSNWMGMLRAAVRSDFVVENGYLTSSQLGTSAIQPLLLRYVSDFSDVSAMSPLFQEMLASRLAQEMAPALVEAELLSLTLQNCRAHYRSERRSAISINAIEVGPIVTDQGAYLHARA